MMWLINGILAGLIAGIIMGCISQIGYLIGILKSHLIVIDGKFAFRKISQSTSTPAIYVMGIIIHLITSVAFGVVYALIASIIGFDLRSAWAIFIYVLLLWLAMLFTALPVSGQGIMGKKISRFAWLEQLIHHIVFGFSFWWALGII
jgi:hypothetical protein